MANELAELDEVRFGTPNFVSEYRRTARIPEAQWHLRNTGMWECGTADQVPLGEDVDAMGAWRLSEGRGVVVAVIDDGVDIDHPNLRAGVWRNPDRTDPDRHGRDYFIPDDNPDHFDPRPKSLAPRTTTPTATTSTAPAVRGCGGSGRRGVGDRPEGEGARREGVPCGPVRA